MKHKLIFKFICLSFFILFLFLLIFILFFRFLLPLPTLISSNYDDQRTIYSDNYYDYFRLVQFIPNKTNNTLVLGDYREWYGQSIKIEIYQLQDLNSLLNYIESEPKPLPLSSLNKLKTITLPLKYNKSNFEFSQGYSFIDIPFKFSPGYYLIVFPNNHNNHITTPIFVQVSNLTGALIRSDADQYLVWTHFINGNYASNVNVYLMSYIGSKIYLGQTNEKGLLKFKKLTSQHYPWIIIDNNKDKIAIHSSFSPNRQISTSYWAFLNLDSETYLPTDKVKFWLWLKNLNNRPLGHIKIVLNKGFGSGVHTLKEQIFYSNQVAGDFSGEWFNLNLEPGNYTISVFDSNNNLIKDKIFTVSSLQSSQLSSQASRSNKTNEKYQHKTNYHLKTTNVKNVITGYIIKDQASIEKQIKLPFWPIIIGIYQITSPTKYELIDRHLIFTNSKGDFTFNVDQLKCGRYQLIFKSFLPHKLHFIASKELHMGSCLSDSVIKVNLDIRPKFSTPNINSVTCNNSLNNQVVSLKECLYLTYNHNGLQLSVLGSPFNWSIKNNYFLRQFFKSTCWTGEGYVRAIAVLDPDPESYLLNIDLKTDKDNYQVSDQVKLSFKITNHNGDSVKSRVYIGLSTGVDVEDQCRVRQLLGFYSPLYLEDDMFSLKPKFFYETREYHNYPSQCYVSRPLLSSSDRFLFKTFLTNKYGQATLKFKLPDKKSTWKFDIYAISNSSISNNVYMGYKTLNIKTN